MFTDQLAHADLKRWGFVARIAAHAVRQLLALASVSVILERAA